MKSRTSFFNFTAFRKNITRFVPVWALYTVFLLLVLFAISGQEATYMARDISYITRLAGVGNLLYAGIVALCLFGDLYKGRLCNALHAFPMRREGWLLTNIANGFLFSLIPNLLVCTITSFQLGEYANYIWYLFAVASLQYIFFFGTAVLSALCAGNKLGMMAVYGIIHFIVVLVYFLAEVIYQPLIYGVELQTDKFYRFFPLFRMFDEYVITDFGMGTIQLIGFDKATWTHLYLCAGVGVVAFALAWLVYRRRHLERAGDFIALRPLAPVFLCVYTIAVGTVLYSFFEMVGKPSYVIYGVGIIIGFFTGQMLLNRTVKVFYKKSWIAFGVLVLVLSGSMALTWLDPMGIGSYIPSVDKVKSASIYGPDKSYYYYDQEEFDSFAITDLEEIKSLQAFHEKLMTERPTDGGYYYDVRIHYNLADGNTVDRYYRVQMKSPLTKEAAKWFSDARYVFQIDDPTQLYQLIGGFHIDRSKYDEEGNWSVSAQDFEDPAQVEGLLNAILADCAAGNMAQFWDFHNGDGTSYNIELELHEDISKEFEDEYRFGYLSVYSDCTNTIAYLEKLLEENPNDSSQQETH